MSAVARKLVLVVLLGIVVTALAFYVFEGSSWESIAMASFLILVWTPIKGVSYRRLGGAKPYTSALAANASSELAGLPVHLGLSFWPLMGTSFLVSAAIEALALAAMGTASSWKRCLVVAAYGSLVVHVFTVGWFASFQSLALGVPFLLLGVILFHAPTFFPDEWVSLPQSTP